MATNPTGGFYKYLVITQWFSDVPPLVGWFDDSLVTVTSGSGVSGTLAFTTGGISFAGSGTETISGSLTATLGSITFAGSGLETETGALAFTTSGISFAGSGTETEIGTLTFISGGIQFAGIGTVTSADVTGTLAFTTDSIVFAGSGIETETGQVSVTTDGISFAGRGQIVYARDTHDGFTKREQRKTTIKKRDEKLKQEIQRQFERIIEGKTDNPQKLQEIKEELYTSDYLDRVMLEGLLSRIEGLEQQLLEIDEEEEILMLM